MTGEHNEAWFTALLLAENERAMERFNGYRPTLNGHRPTPKADPAIWVDAPDSEARRAARGETLPERCCGDVDEMTPAERIRYYEDCIRGARADLCAVAHDHNAEDEPCLHPEPDPTHTPAVRRVVAWETHGGELERERDDAYWSVAMDMIASAYRRCPSRLRGETVDGWWNLHWRWPRVSRLAACLRHRDEKAGYR